MRVELQHAGDQILKVIRVVALTFALRLRMRLPEQVRPVGSEKVVIAIIFASLGQERWVAGAHDEENDTEGEKIDDLALIRHLGDNFRSHVARRADLRTVDARAITTLKRAGEAEIYNLDIEVLVK